MNGLMWLYYSFLYYLKLTIMKNFLIPNTNPVSRNLI